MNFGFSEGQAVTVVVISIGRPVPDISLWTIFGKVHDELVIKRERSRENK